mmetsp:Transcript_3773/g.10749  ORF Transcript_3773/g.10749 Transcript_3773/m.10749 type:complete len:86 (+) Transcript_3773:3043-3300(+)
MLAMTCFLLMQVSLEICSDLVVDYFRKSFGGETSHSAKRMGLHTTLWRGVERKGASKGARGAEIVFLGGDDGRLSLASPGISESR